MLCRSVYPSQVFAELHQRMTNRPTVGIPYELDSKRADLENIRSGGNKVKDELRVVVAEAYLPTLGTLMCLGGLAWRRRKILT